MTDRRALSNTLGFVLLFGVVFVSIAAISTLGVGALEEGRDTTIAQNAAMSMESLSNAVDDLREENTTTRVSVIRGASGSLSPGDETTIKVWVGNPDTTDPVYDRNFEPIIYRLEDERIVYEAGALIRTQEDGGGLLLDPPEYRVTDEVAILPMIGTTDVNDGGVSANTVTTYLEKTSAELRTPSLPSNTVTVEITTGSQRTDVWHDLLENRHSMACSVSGDTVSCTSTSSVDTVIVRDIRLTYEFVT